jgi:pimeloyl-ACP methyl ester carboxylesterase
MTEIIRLPDGRLASYRAFGRGIPTLMFPGGPGLAASHLAADAALFPFVLRSYLIDPPGTGASTPPADPADYHSAAGCARFYEQAREALGVPRVVVFGHSSGALAALAYAAMYPARTVACVAVAPFDTRTGPDTDSASAALEAMAERHVTSPWYPEARPVLLDFGNRVADATDSAEVEKLIRIVLPFSLAHPDSPEAGTKLARMGGALKASLAAARAWEGGILRPTDIRPLLGGISCPTLFLAGELDFIGGPAQARRIAGDIRQSELVVLPDCGHLPALDAPDEYQEVFVDFYRSRERARQY